MTITEQLKPLTRPTTVTALEIDAAMRRLYARWLRRTRPVWRSRRYVSPVRFRERMRTATGTLPEELDALEQAAVTWASKHADRSVADAERVEARLHAQAAVIRQALQAGEDPTDVQARTAFIFAPPMGNMRGADKTHRVLMPPAEH